MGIEQRHPHGRIGLAMPPEPLSTPLRLITIFTRSTPEVGGCECPLPSLESLTKLTPYQSQRSESCSPSVLGCSIHEHPFASRCFVESNSTAAAAFTAQTQRRQTSLTTPCLLNGDSLCAPQRHTVGDAATGTGLRFWNDLLAAVTRLARGGHLATDPLLLAGLAVALRGN